MELERQCVPTEGVSLLLNGTKILFVDDNADMRMLFRFILEDHGADIMVVESAQEALVAVEQWQPQILVSDLCMPGEDGYSLLRKVRSLDPDRGGQIPAIALTGSSYRGINGFHDPSLEFQLYLVKPVEPNKLVTAIVRLMQQATSLS